ncbi:hypothetical protein B0H21DRAFT_527104 [Amylocystis lapponica]|nr:hypothetical protein B0H21DRAFT_527104 [Amylocystis lapponica]
MHSRSVQLLELSEELLLIILGELDTRSLFTCKRVCRALAHIITNAVYLRYNVELEIAGMVDVSQSSRISTAEKIRKLTLYRDSWYWLNFYPDVARPVEPPMRWITSDGHTLIRIHENNVVQASRLSSNFRNIQEHAWTVGAPAINKMTCALDTAQDLLVIAEEEDDGDMTSGDLYLCSLSTGGNHPLAVHPILHVPESSSANSLLIRGDVVAWMLREIGMEETETSLRLWNWKSGQLVWYQQSVSPESMAFLNDRYFVVAQLDGQLVVHTYDAAAISASEPAPDDYVCRLPLPRLALGGEYSAMVVASRPQSYPVSNNVPFYPQLDSPLLIWAFEIINPLYGAYEATGFALFISAAVILSLTEIALTHPWIRDMRWEDWGPKNTRLVQKHWLCLVDEVHYSVLGWKACLSRRDDPDNPIDLHVFDFAPLGVLRSMYDNPGILDSPMNQELVMAVMMLEPPQEEDFEAETGILADEWASDSSFNYFGGVVRTALPCRVSRTFIVPLSPDDGRAASAILMADGIVVHNMRSEKVLTLC